jgi:hypothetical protein
MLDDLERGIVQFFIICIGIAFAVGGFFVWALPKVWGVLKPIIHNITA